METLFRYALSRLFEAVRQISLGVSWGILIDLICKAPTNTSPNYGEPPRLAANRSGRWGGGGAARERRRLAAFDAVNSGSGLADTD